MKTTKVTYLKTFPLGRFINEKIGIEVELNDGDDVQSALAYARSECELNHKTNNPHLFQDQPQLSPEYTSFTHISNDYSEPIKPKLSPSQRIINQINECTDIVVLKTFELLSKNNKEIKEAYNNQLNKLK